MTPNEERSSLSRLSTEALQAQMLQRLAVAIIQVLNEDGPFPETIDRVLNAIQDYTGIEAVAIRLRKGDDFRYFATRGLSPHFREREDSLLWSRANGDFCKDETGKPRLECTCGLVVAGRIDSSMPGSTPGGSCFANQGALSMLFGAPSGDPRWKPRGGCFAEGYQSMAVVPVRAHHQIVGLLQLCDKRPDCFNRSMIEFFEGLSSSIGLALTRKQAEDELKSNAAKLNLALTSVEIGTWRWDVVNGRRYFDEQTCKLLGIDPSEFTGTATEFFDVIHPEDRAGVQSALQRTLHGAGTYEIEYRVLWKDGSIRHISARGKCVRDSAGQPAAIEGVVWDITQRREAECALRRHDAIQRAIISNISDVIAIVDANGVNQFKSLNLEKLFGWSPDDVVGKSVAEHLHPDERHHLMSALQALATEPSGRAQGNCRYLCGDGTHRWIEYNAVNLRNDPDIAGVLLNYHDITERKIADDHLRLLQATINLAPDDIFWLDSKGRIRFANTASYETLGYDIDALSMVPIWDIVPRLGDDRWTAFWERVKSGERVVFESTIRSSDGSDFPAEIASTYVSFGTDEYVCCFVRDITERQQTLAALHESEEMYRVLFEQSRDALMTLSPPHWRFHDCNAASIGLFGVRDAPEFRQHSPWELSPEQQPDGRDSKSKAREMIDVAMQQGAHSFEWIHRRVTGEEFPATVLLTRIELNGLQMLQATVRDESERKLMIARMAQSDRLASMGMLAAGVAHEINNPLAYVRYNIESLAEDVPLLTRTLKSTCNEIRGILGPAKYSDLMGERAELFESNSLDDIVERITESLEGIQRIVSITRTLSTFSRVEQVNRSQVDVGIAIESAINMAHSEVAARARIVKQFDNLPKVWASEGKLSQVLLNLIVNAAQAIDEDNVAENLITIRAWAEGSNVFVEVSDTGKGIATENQEKIFEPFFTTKKFGDGAGLGLSISRNILSEFGGNLSVRSEVGVGSTFKVRLPVFVEPIASNEEKLKPRADEAAGVRARILLIDDESNIARSLIRLLGNGYSITAVGSGKDAKDLIVADSAFDLILCDLMMSQMSGIEFHSWLVTHNPRLAGQLIFITGGAFTPNAREYLANVGNLTIQKPFEVDELRTQIAAAVRAARAANVGQ